MKLEVADLPSGPLDLYRKKASFNWKDMLLFIEEEEEILAFKVAVTSTPPLHTKIVSMLEPLNEFYSV